MDSNSQPPNSVDPHSTRVVDIVGAAIALLTLATPLFIIGNYSQNPIQNQQSLTYESRSR